jgi:hypothetical protein
LTVFFEEFFSTGFYSQLGSDFRTNFSRGQILRTHVYYATEDLNVWRPAKSDSTKTSASEFSIVPPPENAFNRETPLYAPRLEVHEEFMVVRAKERPVLLIAPMPDLIEAKKVRRGGKINLHLCVAAPLYTVADKDGFSKYDGEFINRIRRLEFPQLFFLPEHPKGLLRPCICRLDRVQSCYVKQVEPTNVCLSEQVLRVFQGQIEFFLTESYAGDYAEYREELLHPE